jgi:hypothetical protein
VHYGSEEFRAAIAHAEVVADQRKGRKPDELKLNQLVGRRLARHGPRRDQRRLLPDDQAEHAIASTMPMMATNVTTPTQKFDDKRRFIR